MSSDASRLSCSGQSPAQRDAHGMAVTQLLLQELERWPMCHLGSPGSSRCLVQWEGPGAESWVSPKLPLLSRQAALPARCPQPQGTSPQLGAGSPRSSVLAVSPRLTPAACPATAPSAARSCGKRRTSHRSRCPWPGHRHRWAPAPRSPAVKHTMAGRGPVGQE